MQYHQGPGFSLCSFFSAFYVVGTIVRGSHWSLGLLLTLANWQLKSKPHHPHTNSLGQELVSFCSLCLPFCPILNHVLTCSLHPSFTGLFQAHQICYSSIKARGFPRYIPPPLHLVNTHSNFISQCKPHDKVSPFYMLSVHCVVLFHGNIIHITIWLVFAFSTRKKPCLVWFITVSSASSQCLDSGHLIRIYFLIG